MCMSIGSGCLLSAAHKMNLHTCIKNLLDSCGMLRVPKWELMIKICMLDVICGDRCGDRARCALKGWKQCHHHSGSIACHHPAARTSAQSMNGGFCCLPDHKGLDTVGSMHQRTLLTPFLSAQKFLFPSLPSAHPISPYMNAPANAGRICGYDCE